MKALGVFLFMAVSTQVFSQSLESYRWKNRIIILTGNQEEVNESLSNYTNKTGINERKVMFFCLDGKQLIPLPKNEKSILYTKPTFINNSYHFYLIGLDGGMKEKRMQAMSQKELFELIDSMPMRATELRKRYE